MNGNFIVLDAISNVVITKADMLGSLVELIVLRESDRRLIIGVEWHDNGKIGVDLLEDMAEPQASLLASVIAMYSASVVESATIGCFLDRQEIAPHPNTKAYPEIE